MLDLFQCAPDRMITDHSHGRLDAMNKRPIRVLHVVSRMHRAGVETWLMHLLRHADRSEYQMDFLVHSEEPAHYDAEIRALGSKQLFAAPLRRVMRYRAHVKHLLRDHPPYDIVHSHLDCFGGYPLRCAAEAGIPVRIAYMHVDLAAYVSHLRWSLQVYSRYSQSLVRRYGTLGISVTKDAGRPLFAQWGRPWRTLSYGIDLGPLRPTRTRSNARAEFGIPDGVIVIGHAGRFAEQKNHTKFVEITEAIRRKTDKFHVVLAGDGPLRQEIEREVVRRGLSKHVAFVGVRADIPRLLTSLFDVVLFPSLFEGNPVFITEAQAAGCPVVMSNTIAREADLVPEVLTRLPLSLSADKWADAVLEVGRRRRSPKDQLAAHETVVNSPMNILRSTESLLSLYRQSCVSRRAA